MKPPACGNDLLRSLGRSRGGSSHPRPGPTDPDHASQVAGSLMSDLVTRAWNGTPIQRRTIDGFVNATAMAKASGKEWAHYFRTDRATTYIEALSRNCEIAVTSLYIAKPGEGTWIHPRLAVDFARWISADFAVWMDAWFLEELTGGRVSQVRDTQIPALAASHREDTEFAMFMADVVGKAGGDPKESLAVSFTVLARKHPEYRDVFLENQKLLCPAQEAFGNPTQILERLENELGTEAVNRLTVMAKDGGLISRNDKRLLVNAILCERGLQFRTGIYRRGAASYGITPEGAKYAREETRPANYAEEGAWVPQLLWKLDTTVNVIISFVKENVRLA